MSYDFRQNQFVIRHPVLGSHTLRGFTSGSAPTPTYTSEDFSQIAGEGGEVCHAVQNNSGGEIAFSLNHDSPSIDFMQQVKRYQADIPSTVFEFGMSYPTGSSDLFKDCKLSIRIGQENSADAKNRQFKIPFGKSSQDLKSV